MAPESTPLKNLAGGKPAASGDFLLQRRLRICRPYLTSHRGVLLDYGCGNGAQTLHFTDHFDTVRGLDVEADFLADFQNAIAARGLGETVSAERFAGTRLPLEDESVDQVVSFTVLEHVPDQDLALREMHRVLRPGGRLILSVPNKWWVFETHGANLPLLPWNRVPLVSWWPKFLHDRYARARIYRAQEIKQLVRDKGFAVVDVLRMTAPMDVIKWRPLRDLLRGTLFRSDKTKIPFLATEVFVVADKARL